MKKKHFILIILYKDVKKNEIKNFKSYFEFFSFPLSITLRKIYKMELAFRLTSLLLLLFKVSYS